MSNTVHCYCIVELYFKHKMAVFSSLVHHTGQYRSAGVAGLVCCKFSWDWTTLPNCKMEHIKPKALGEKGEILCWNPDMLERAVWICIDPDQIRSSQKAGSVTGELSIPRRQFGGVCGRTIQAITYLASPSTEDKGGPSTGCLLLHSALLKDQVRGFLTHTTLPWVLVCLLFSIALSLRILKGEVKPKLVWRYFSNGSQECILAWAV